MVSAGVRRICVGGCVVYGAVAATLARKQRRYSMDRLLLLFLPGQQRELPKICFRYPACHGSPLQLPKKGKALKCFEQPARRHSALHKRRRARSTRTTHRRISLLTLP
jgi:hypothetical protein